MHLFVSKNNTLAPARINAQWLTEQVALPFLMQMLPPHTLYLILQKQDLQENLELVEWIRGGQLQKILDFDIWEFNSQLETEDISYQSSLSWVQTWLALGKTFTAERFFELEEETALLMLTKFFTIIPEGITHITDDIRENWATTPDKRFFIKPISSDGTDFEILTEFIDALYGADMRKAGFLFSAAALLVRQDTLELGQKWRENRLADQGFIPRHEAYSALFSTNNIPKPLSKFNYRPSAYFTYEDARENILNFLSSMDQDDSVHLMKQVLGTDGIKQLTGAKNINLEHLYDDLDFMNDCVDQIVQISGKTFHELERTQAHLSLQGESEAKLLVEQVLDAFWEKDETQFLLVKQKIAHISNTVASAISNKAYQDNTVNTALIVVRGCLNIGLEFCLENNDLYQLSFDTKDTILNSIICFEKLGVDYIFKVGFQAIMDLQKNLLNYLYDNKLITSKKTNLATHWLNSEGYTFSSEMLLACEGLLNTIPMCHTELFSEDNVFKEIPIYLSQQFKPFEHKSEVVFVQRFLQKIQLNLN